MNAIKIFIACNLFLLLSTNSAIGQSTNEFIRLAEDYKRNQKPDSAIIFYEKASAEFQTLGKTEEFINAYNQIGILLTRQDNYEKAKTYLEKALLTGLSSLDTNNLIISTTYISLGVIYNAEENYDKSILYHNKALSIRLFKLGQDHAEVATSYGNLGNVYRNKGDINRSIESHLKALEIRSKVFGLTSAEIIESYVGLGNAFREKKEYSASLEYFEKALKNKIIQRGEGHKDLVKFYKYISDVYYLMNNKEQGDLYKSRSEEILMN